MIISLSNGLLLIYNCSEN
jgi:WD40 repeat protein